MTKVLDNKCALVCGGSRGLGFGAATELAKKGCKIILLGRSTSMLKEGIETINTLNGKQKHQCRFQKSRTVAARNRKDSF